MAKLSTESYKGVRDFYPRDAFLHDYIRNTMARVCETFGYERYDASLLEPAELYRSKTSEEIVGEQTYTFEDRGGREVTLRPEMTPTVARLVAARRRELSFPLRWYSIPNVFRYERPQRGRLREHWQLNADLFGVAGIDAEVEIIALAHAVMTAFGAAESDFEIRVSDRRILEDLYDEVDLERDKRTEMTRLLDRRDKVENFHEQALEILDSDDRTEQLLAKLDSLSSDARLQQLIVRLQEMGVQNAFVDARIVRGFDYYTGMVFEVFDTSGENRRSLFGGGRYDNLLEVFGAEHTPAVGFGMGDVTMQDFLETHNLAPEYVSPTDLMLCLLDESVAPFAERVAAQLRDQDIAVAINYSYKKAGDQIKVADKKEIPFVACIGTQEAANNTLTVKHLQTHEEKVLTIEEIADHIFSSGL